VAGIANYRARRGGEVAARLASAARACGSAVALGVSDLLRECSAPANIWTATDLDASGELFDGVGIYAACGCRLCPSCSASLRRRSRRRARVALESCQLRRGEHHRFITLTMPTMTGAPLVETMRVVQRAWSLFSRRRFWLSAVRAGIKGVEFTITPTGYHTHLHVLAISTWIAHAGLRAEWSHCVRKAWAEQGRAVIFNTPTGEAIVDVRLVRAKRQGSRVVISTEAALQEVTKYVTKSESWDALPDEHLVGVAEVQRWARLFEVFGDARPPRGGKERASEGGDASLDTKEISRGGAPCVDASLRASQPARARPPTLRELMIALDRQTWLSVLALRFAERRAYRKAALCDRYSFARFETLAGEVSLGSLIKWQR